MSVKKIRNAEFTFQIEGKTLQVDVSVVDDEKLVSYEIRSEDVVLPKYAAYCLYMIVKGMCHESGIGLDALMAFEEDDDTDGHLH